MLNKGMALLQNNRELIVNSMSLMGTTGVTSLLGFAYWWTAAQLFPQAAYGLSSAAVSAMMLLGSLGLMGMGTLLVGELPKQPHNAGTFIMTGLLVCALAGGMIGIVFAVLAPGFSSELAPLSDGIGIMLIFTAGVALTSMTMMLDQALIGLLRGSLQLWRNVLFAGSKLVFLVLIGLVIKDAFGMLIYAAWAAGNVLSLLVLAVMLIRQGDQIWHRPRWDFLQNLGGTALSHHALDFAIEFPSFILPVMVTALISAEQNAIFFSAWMIAQFVFLTPMHITTVLYAVGSQNMQMLAEKMRLTLNGSAALGLVGVILLWILAYPVLLIIGRVYADESAWILRIISVAVFPLLVKYHFVAIQRITGNIRPAALIFLVTSSFEVLLATLGSQVHGLVGFTLGWVIGNIIVASAMFPFVYRTMRLKYS